MVIGKGSEKTLLGKEDVVEICQEAFENRKLEGKRILVIIPDNTRTAPMDILFRVIYRLLVNRAKTLDFIVALGTHPLMSDDAINRRVGIKQEERKKSYPKALFFNHNWKDPQQLKWIGTIKEDEVTELSNGLMKEKVDVVINKIVFDYDLLLIVGPVFPHEVVGFSGGNKYFFPGLAGQEIIDTSHWLGALITNPVIIGTKDTPVRAMINKAASFLPMEKMCISLVVRSTELAGLFIGTPEESWSMAADLSAKLDIVYKEHPFKKVLSCSPEMYEDLWTGGKCAYKLEPVVAEGGELIIYAPHIKQISVVHGKLIEKIGYHVRDYFLKQWDRFKDVPGGIRAHSTHVKGIGGYENGIEKPRMNVVLATQIPEEVCKKVNLGYRDPKSINIEEWQNREDEGILFVPSAGEMLYRLKDNPFKKKVGKNS